MSHWQWMNKHWRYIESDCTVASNWNCQRNKELLTACVERIIAVAGCLKRLPACGQCMNGKSTKRAWRKQASCCCWRLESVTTTTTVSLLVQSVGKTEIAYNNCDGGQRRIIARDGCKRRSIVVQLRHEARPRYANDLPLCEERMVGGRRDMHSATLSKFAWCRLADTGNACH